LYIGEKDGELLWVDMSYTDPYEYVRTPLIALMRGDNWQEKVIEAGKQTLEPFLGEEILAGAVVDVWRNTKANGGQVYNPAQSLTEQAEDMAAHLAQAFEPGTISSARRIWRGLSGYTSPYGKDYDPKIESLAVFTGHRIQTLDVPQALQFKGRDFARQASQASRILNSVATRHGRATQQEVREAYESMDRARREAFQALYESVSAARKLNMTEKQIRRTLDTAGVSNAKINAALSGVYIPYYPSDRVWNNTYETLLTDVRDPQERERIIREVRERQQVVEEMTRQAYQSRDLRKD
jgi:hypothetical protein